jgi:demethylmenaquinone methyltransferase / 2-methoxy-6-polyprenyl-1,4-benzoquinol methylase
MAQLSGKKRSNYMRRMFGLLAERYDLANRWMTWGQDVKWRREVIDRTHLPVGGKLLDIGTGTGELAVEARRRDGHLFVVGIDVTPEMLRVGKLREGAVSVCWLNSDALDLPFNSGLFDAVVSGYLLRNVIDVERALAEQHRVLKVGGIVVCLDTTPPPEDFRHIPERLYLRFIIPVIGGWVTGDREPYRYLPESTRQFMCADELAQCIHRVGFREIGFRRFMGSTMAMHWGVR